MRGVLDTALSDKVCLWFSLGPLIFSTNKTDRHNITEILLEVALDTIKQTNIYTLFSSIVIFVCCPVNCFTFQFNMKLLERGFVEVNSCMVFVFI